MDHQSLGLSSKNISSTQTICPHSSEKMQDSTKEGEQMKVAESLSSSVDGGPRGVEEEEKTLEPEIVESDCVSVIVYPKISRRNINDKIMKENESSSNPRAESREEPASSFFSPNQQEKLSENLGDMDDNPLDLSIKSSASLTKETIFSSEKKQYSETEDIQLYSVESDLTHGAKFSSSEENSEGTSVQGSKKFFRFLKENEVKKRLKITDVITRKHVNFSRKRKEGPSTNSEAKRSRDSFPASSSDTADNSTLPSDSDYSETSSAHYLSFEPSTSTGESCSNDSTAIQEPSTSPDRLSRFSCERCGKGFPSKSQLERHFLTHTGGYDSTAIQEPSTSPDRLSRFSYERCGKGFPSNFQLERHFLTHTGGYDSTEIQVHAPDISQELPFVCKNCNKGFLYRSELTIHEGKHTGERPYGCKYCDQSFTIKSHVKRHIIRIHTSKRDFQCEKCKKSFATKYDLVAHFKRHTEKAYRCKCCKKSFTRQQELKRHYISHSAERPYKCTRCSKDFKYKDVLKKHETTHKEK